MKNLITIITVNYNRAKFLENFFNSLSRIDKGNFLIEVILVDNLSNDDSVDLVKKKFPEIKILKNDVNNYTKALNLGLKEAKGDYIAFLNNDVTIEKNWLKGLMEVIELNKNIGAVQSKILFSDGKIINSVGIEEVEDFYFKDIGFDEKDKGQYEDIMEISFFSGGSVLFRRECLEATGKFDEDFIMYCEDIEYSLRCRNLGWKLFYSPKSIVYHKYHGSVSSRLCEYFYSRNRLLTLAIHFPLRLASGIKTSHFFLKNEMDCLYHSLIQSVRKLLEYNDTETVNKILDQIKEIIPDILGKGRAYNFFKQLEIVLGFRKIKIGIYDHAFHFAGGGQRYVAKLAEILQDKYEITYIANKEITLEKYKEWFGIDLSRCKLKIIKIPFFEKHERFFIDEGMAVHEDENPFDIISAESFNYDIFINANMLGKVKPLSCLSMFICHFPDRDKEKFFWVDQYDYIITNSEYTSYWLKQKWGLSHSTLLYPPIDMLNKNINGKQKKSKTILSVARFEPGGSKKQLELVKTFNEICKKNKHINNEWVLILAGGSSENNPYFDRVQKEIDFINAKNIKLMPNLTNIELQKLYAEALIFWHACGLDEKSPNLIEHFGMTTVEAMQNYCVPIVIDGGGQVEIVDHEKNGFRFKTTNKLKDYTLKVINNDKLMQTIANNAFKKSQVFNIDIFTEKVNHIFKNLEARLMGGEKLI